ncbi:hypothetical protein EN904_03000 [Mesorhizobium sp. M7A.F.Ca.CA.001.07.2.1]|nr:hypothetical protein EN982_06765 [Mesorhizobium sp. M7A.F.Ca.CA.004.08.1.1]RUY07722.1 hypothetical protein EN985_02255 [Mesorhizobium sp. M7A.F.Ca.CA.004.04.1.1]RUY57716.1 hypothetical protein EN973_05455 [Mesorhizobium sp. M7A.F.Ca.CA.001.12.1.1]RUY93178.1 hypothetical protein EN964_01870 [Mesorhizobium sp. M7A.F.Ca.CA.001.10.2.1]RVA26373.1 hypothetical protein EN930_18035 [Mesorhizobium sp. M7A.F.Ca.CA.004.11.2.1]RVA38649.1 hypothetical protein EN928_18595 [Mesorhizobium sp. M7A.F.Ca.CA.0
MRLGHIIANAFAAGLIIVLVAGVFLLFGKPLWPERHVRMVIIPPAHRMPTSAVNNTGPDLPTKFDLSIVRPRPLAKERS